MTSTRNYASDAADDARDMAENYLADIVVQLRDSGAASDDFNNDYDNGDAYHHENHVDRAYSLSEAADLLDQLAEYEETDSGLWHGLAPRDAISAQAAYTYGNAVASMWHGIIANINADAECGILADMLGEDDPASDEVITERVREIIREE